MAEIILASSSPRRAELLGRIGIGSARIVKPEVVEEMDYTAPPEDVVAKWSLLKASEVASRSGADDLIIAADTVVWHNGLVLGKPRNSEEAYEMLNGLSGQWHSVYTGLTVMRGDKCVTQEEITSVLIRPLSDEEIRDYIATGEPMDKAGAYGIQELGAVLVERVDGDFYNVMGLPVTRLALMLKDFGFDLLKGKFI